MTPEQAEIILTLLKKISIPFGAAKEAVELETCLLKIRTGQIVCIPAEEHKDDGGTTSTKK